MSVTTNLRRTAVRAGRSIRRWQGRRPMGPGRPPEVPAGWGVGPPDFVGVGAQKAGTSWWAALIHEHPRVERTGGVAKELHFFDRCWESGFGASDIALYASYFPRPIGALAGEWTPGYRIDFWGPELIARAAPKTRILVLLRDPLDRFRSGLTHTDDTSRKALSHRDAAGAFQRGLYGQQLQRVIDAFPREQILIQQYEACRADAAGELARTFAFIGLPPATIDAGRFSRPVNPTTARKVELTPNLRTALLDGYAPDLERLRSLAPELDLTLWPSAREALGV
jgi:hypothetical protein